MQKGTEQWFEKEQACLPGTLGNVWRPCVGTAWEKGSMLLASVELKEAANTSVVTHIYDPSSQETEAGVLQAKATLGCV